MIYIYIYPEKPSMNIMLSNNCKYEMNGCFSESLNTHYVRVLPVLSCCSLGRCFDNQTEIHCLADTCIKNTLVHSTVLISIYE